MSAWIPLLLQSISGSSFEPCVPFDTAECFCFRDAEEILIGELTYGADSASGECFLITDSFGRERVPGEHVPGRCINTTYPIAYSSTSGTNRWLIVRTPYGWVGAYEIDFSGGINFVTHYGEEFEMECASLPAASASWIAELSVQGYSVCHETLHETRDLPSEDCLPSEGRGCTSASVSMSIFVSAFICLGLLKRHRSLRRGNSRMVCGVIGAHRRRLR